MADAVIANLEAFKASAIRLSKAGYAALDAQRRYDHWSSFGTNSARAQKAEGQLDAAMRELEAADEELAQLLQALADAKLHTICNPPESKFCGREDCPTCQGRFWERK